MDRSHDNHPLPGTRGKFQHFPFNLPNELCQLIADCLDQASLACLVQTCRHLFDLLSRDLYRIALTYKVNWGKTPVCEWAMVKSHIGLIEKLLQLDPAAISNSQFREGFVRTAREGNLVVVKHFINRYSDRLDLPKRAYDALDEAACCGRLPVVKFLIHEVGVNVSEMYATGKYSTLCLVAFNGHLHVAEELRLAYNPIILEKNSRGQSAIHSAARGGQNEMAAYLVQHKADVSAADERNWTPIFWACVGMHMGHQHPTLKSMNPKGIEDYKEMIKLLVAEGADVSHLPHDGMGILQLVATDATHASALIELFISFGADPNIMDRRSTTALHGAAVEHNIFAMTALLKAGADTEIQDVDGKTALHYAATRDYYDSCELLLEAGASPWSADNGGLTPMQCAVNNNNTRSIRVLLRHEEDRVARQTDDAQMPLLLKAVLNDDFEVMEVLLMAGANVNLKYDGTSASDVVAARKSRKEN